MSLNQLYGFSKQIANGMEYLGINNIVHRDIATRNVLLESNLTCKISNFSLAFDSTVDSMYSWHEFSLIQ